MTQAQRKKTGDLMCDIGKYIATAVPLSYVVADKPYMWLVVVIAAFSGFSFIIFGLYFVKKAEGEPDHGGGKRRRVRLLKNAVFQIEEQNPE